MADAVKLSCACSALRVVAGRSLMESSSELAAVRNRCSELEAEVQELRREVFDARDDHVRSAVQAYVELDAAVNGLPLEHRGRFTMAQIDAANAVREAWRMFTRGEVAHLADILAHVIGGSEGGSDADMGSESDASE